MKHIIKVLISLAIPFQSFASQSFLAPIDSRSSPSEYIIQNFTDQKLIEVQLLGGVSKPGFYRVPEKLSFLSLMSYSGGVLPEAKTDEIHISNRRLKSHTTLDLENLLMSPAKDRIVQDGDTIFIARQEPFISNDVVVTVTLVATIFTILSTVAILSNQANNNSITPPVLTF